MTLLGGAWGSLHLCLLMGRSVSLISGMTMAGDDSGGNSLQQGSHWETTALAWSKSLIVFSDPDW